MPTFTYACIEIAQRPEAPRFCIFSAKGGDVLKWAAIRRLQDNPASPQRSMNKSKVRSLKRFLESDSRNSVPTAIVLTINVSPEHFTRVVCGENRAINVLSLEVAEGCADDAKPGLVIDGQHRLLGIREFNPELPVAVIALLNATPLETAFQFLVINNKASKVSTDHLRALVLDFDQAGLEARLDTARLSLDETYRFLRPVDNDEESPFRSLLNWPANRTGQKVIVPASIEASLADIQARKVKAFEDDDTLLEFFFTIWMRIKTRWPDLWPESRLLSKVGIVCMSAYVVEALVQLADWGQLDLRNPDDIRQRTDQLLEYQPKEFWTTSWTSTSYDTKAGRQIIIEALTKAARNMRAGLQWYTEIDLIDRAEGAA